MYSLFLFTLCMADLAIIPDLLLEPVPESAGYMQVPQNMAIDDEGRIYILDSEARKVFVWNGRGHFINHFGGEGNGPGEFAFPRPRYTYITLLNNQVVVCDGKKREFHLFERNGTFLKTVALSSVPGRIRHFSTTRNHRVLLFQQNYLENPPITEVLLYDNQFKPIRSLASYKDRYFSPIMKNEKRVGWLINAFTPEIFLHANPGSTETIVGMGDKPEFNLYDESGKRIKTIRFNMKPVEVTREDREEYRQLPWIKNDPNNKVHFPEWHPYYQLIFPVRTNEYLVIRRSPFYSRYWGILINRSGETRGKFSYDCGRDGGLYGHRGRIFAGTVDDRGDFIFRELNISVRPEVAAEQTSRIR